jgi:excisionase family DNA binding protein
MAKHEESLWRIEDLAEYLAMSAGEVQELVDVIGIPHLKIGKHLRFRKTDIDRWLDSLRSPSLRQASAPPAGPLISLSESRKGDSRNTRPYDSSKPTQLHQPPFPTQIKASQEIPAPNLDVRVSEYRHLQERLGELGEINGFRVTLDQSIPEEETPIEAVLERDAWKLACLILLSLPVNKDILRIRRCLCSGFDEAAIVFTSRRHVQQAEPLITQQLTKEDLVRVHLLASDELSSYVEGIITFVSERTHFVCGYKVRTRYYRTNPADQERRKRELIKVVAESMLRQRIAAMRES